MKLSPEKLNEFIERVKGTTLNMSTVLEEEFDVPGGIDGLDPSQLLDIDSEIFECERCNWICADDERVNEDDVCRDCLESE
ncbi:Uncharacterised protein [uncultured archaeon]|nr:Uncharacterised protein [uncultured archaeon]